MVVHRNLDDKMKPFYAQERLWMKGLIFTVVISASVYLIFFLWSGWADVFSALRRIGVSGSLLVFFMSLCNYGLRFVRWDIYLRMFNFRIHWLSNLRMYLSGFALTTTPGKSGEMVRAIFFKKHGVPVPVVLSLFFCERFSDLIAIVLLALLTLSSYPGSVDPVFIAISTALVLLAYMALPLLANALKIIGERFGKPWTWIEQIESVLDVAVVCHRFKVLIPATIISVVAWGAEAVAFYWVLDWMGISVGLDLAILIYALSMLAGALSFLPGGLGSTELTMVSLLVVKGADLPIAVAATAFIRLATLWFAVVIGLIALFRSRGSR
jgi:uncharacterized protein (TIRG00374 family)